MLMKDYNLSVDGLVQNRKDGKIHQTPGTTRHFTRAYMPSLIVIYSICNIVPASSAWRRFS